MNYAAIFVIGLVFVLGCVIWVLRGPKALGENALRRTPRTPIKAAADGQLVRLVGKARPLSGLQTAPISGQPCVLAEVTLAAISKTGTRTQAYAPLRSEVVGQDFLLEDPTGVVLVSLAGSQRYLGPPKFTFVNPGQPAPEAALAFAKQLGADPGQRLRLAEALIFAEQPVAVYGVIRRTGGPAGTLGRIETTPARPVLISNLPDFVR